MRSLRPNHEINDNDTSLGTKYSEQKPPGYELKYSMNVRTKRYLIDINTTKLILNDSDWICFQLSESVFHWLILFLVVKLHMVF